MEIICEQHFPAIFAIVFSPAATPEEAHALRPQHRQALLLWEVRGLLQGLSIFFKTCQIFLQTLSYQVKSEYEEHAAREHPEDLPEDLTPEPVAKTGADLNSMQVQ